MSLNKTIPLLILIKDDRLREALALFFSMQDDIEVVGQTDNVDDARSLLREQTPEVLLFDMVDNGKKRASAIRVLHQEANDTKIIVLSSASDDLTMAEMLEVGAAQYVEKGILASEIVTIIRQIT